MTKPWHCRCRIESKRPTDRNDPSTHSSFCTCYCADCGTPSTQIEYYKVDTPLWKEAVGAAPPISTDKVLCLACLFTRLGREVPYRFIFGPKS